MTTHIIKTTDTIENGKPLNPSLPNIIYIVAYAIKLVEKLVKLNKKNNKTPCKTK